jgi:hypothetical protein
MLLGDTFTTSSPSNQAVAAIFSYLKKHTFHKLGSELQALDFKVEGVKNP